ncbi:Dethiobiotin synthetase [Coleofasciculus sp. G2-EDA-02]|uniref:Dethiobiotin synthetase n=1 Tax=Coleofasciculus sp. G2-EDA-02 TaxID=3069529 RepID=UPI0032F6B2A2
MDYKTARSFIINQTTASDPNTDAFLVRLKYQKPPVPGQVTNILLALKMIFEGLRDASTLDRELVYSLYLLAYESREQFEAGRQASVNWPPLLNEDLKRIARAVESIFSGVWQLT